MGSARSGTTLLGSLIGNAPCTADYRAEPLLLSGCDRCYGPLSHPASKTRFLTDWLRSRQFRRSGLSEKTATSLVDEASSYPQLLRDFMDCVTVSQSRTHWIDSTPSNVYALPTLAEHFPSAKIINIVRDGRAVSASLRKLGWTAVAARSEIAALQYSALKWESSVLAFRSNRHLLPGPVFETSYEALVTTPDNVLPALWRYLEFDDYEIPDPSDADHSKTKVASNSAFGEVHNGLSTAPLMRWRQQLSEKEIGAIEGLVGRTLKDQNYELSTEAGKRASPNFAGAIRRGIFRSRELAKRIVPIRSLFSSPLEIGLE
ncbi:MAG: sulfotransferase [Pseudomonadota bacterium]